PTTTPAVQAGRQGDDHLMVAIGEIRDLLVNLRTVRDSYSTEQVAQLLGKAEFTVREWCRNGRIHAEKKGSGRGKYQSWVVSHAECPAPSARASYPPNADVIACLCVEGSRWR